MSTSNTLLKKITKLEDQSLVNTKRIICEKRARLVGRFYLNKVTERKIRELSESVKHAKGTKSKIRITPEGIGLREYIGKSIITQGPRVDLPLKNTLDLFSDDHVDGIVVIVQLLKNQTFELIYHRVQADDASTLVHAFNIVRMNKPPSKEGSTYIEGYEIELRDHDEEFESNWTLRTKESKPRGTVLTNTSEEYTERKITNDAGADMNSTISSQKTGYEQNKVAAVDQSFHSGHAVSVKNSFAGNRLAAMDHADGDVYATVDMSAKVSKKAGVSALENTIDFESDDSDREYPPPPLALRENGFTEERSTLVEHKDGHIITTETRLQKSATSGKINTKDVQVDQMQSKMRDLSMTNEGSSETIEGQTVTTTYTARKIVRSATGHGETISNGRDTKTVTVSAPPTTVTSYRTADDREYVSPILSDHVMDSQNQSVYMAKVEPHPLTSVVTVNNDALPPALSNNVLDASVTVQETKSVAKNDWVQTSSPVTIDQQFGYSINSARTSDIHVLPSTVEVQPPVVHVQTPPVTHTREYVQQTTPVEGRVLSSTVTVQNHAVPLSSQHAAVQVQQPEPRVLNATVVEERRHVTNMPQNYTYVQDMGPPTTSVLVQNNPTNVLNATVVEQRRMTTAAPQPVITAQNTNQIQSHVIGNTLVRNEGQLNAEVVKITKTSSVKNPENPAPYVVANGGPTLHQPAGGDSSATRTTVMKQVTSTESKQAQAAPAPIASVIVGEGLQNNGMKLNTQETVERRDVSQQPSFNEQQYYRQHMARTASSSSSQNQNRSGQSTLSLRRGDFRTKVAVPLARHHRYYSVRSAGGGSQDGGLSSFDTVSQTSTRSRSSVYKDYVNKPIEKCYERERKRSSRRVMYVEQPLIYSQPETSDIYHRVSRRPHSPTNYDGVHYINPGHVIGS